ncbi:hypothetical protein [Micromonospora sp. NBC_00860]|uniref:hypothetical protein n=1 Tax=Micromonospora sp. NBC_00860 TaxID=2975980 RepID=UPI00386D311B|nr:hypothetical protein OH804_05515 [Micromonospora sp. NBC_00860]
MDLHGRLVERSRRHDTLAAPTSHATLGAAAVELDDVMGRPRAAEDAVNEASARAFVVKERFDGVKDALRGYRQDLLADGTPAKAADRLMAWRFDGEDAGTAAEPQR